MHNLDRAVFLQEQIRHWLSDDVGPADNDRFFAAKVTNLVLQHHQASQWRAGNQFGFTLTQQTHVYWMETVDIFGRVNCRDNLRFIDMGGQAPTALADFFDLKKYPGKRGLRKAPQANLEWALLADGVPRDQVYETLETDEGLARAFKKLDSIKSQVIWWEAGAQPPQLLADGQVTMTSAWNGRIWAAQAKVKQPFKIIWDGQMYDIDVWAVPVGAPNKAMAMDFLRFATSTQIMADQSQYIAYGPTRKSSQPLVQPI